MWKSIIVQYSRDSLQLAQITLFVGKRDDTSRKKAQNDSTDLGVIHFDTKRQQRRSD
jgi:hypothetical protein